MTNTPDRPNGDTALNALSEIAQGNRLSRSDSRELFRAIMAGLVSPARIAAVLAGLRARGESADELAGALDALREVMVSIEPDSRDHLVDTCGTGGGISTFNISTLAAFVVAGAGAKVAKHGNRSFTSRCGSADVLEQLGVTLSVDETKAARILAEAGIVFLYAPAYHPAMKEVQPVRRELRIPTLMNLAGPLANPARVDRQVVGVADRSKVELVVETLRKMGTVHTMVVRAQVGMDEISPAGTTDVWEIREGTVTPWKLDPTRYGARFSEVAGLRGGEPEQNAERFKRILEDPAADGLGAWTVSLNAAAAIYVSGVAGSFEEGIELAWKSLEGRAALAALNRLRSLTAGD